MRIRLLRYGKIERIVTRPGVVFLLGFRESLDRGVTTLHSSTEYDSFTRFTSIVRATERAREWRHVVKLAEPHFGDADFD